MGKRAQSDFLFAQPSALNGIARLVDIAGTFDRYNTSDEADTDALSADWYAVGGDLFGSIISVLPVTMEQESE